MKKLKRPRDINQLTKFIVDIATGQIKENKNTAIKKKKFKKN